MSMRITVEVPNSLGEQLERYRDRLPEILERGIRDLMVEERIPFQDESEVISVLASAPSPEAILSLSPSSALQTRVDELLLQSKSGTLSREGEIELERYLALDHLVRLAKAHAYQKLSRSE